MKPTPLPELLERNRNAATVYLALRCLSGERRRLSTTRARIAALCWLSPKRISEAMTALDECGWVAVNYGRAGIKRWYRLTFPMGHFLPMVTKTTLSKCKVGVKNDPKQTVCYGDKNDPLSLKRDSDAPTPSPIGSAGRSPVEEIEHRRLSEIKAKRLVINAVKLTEAEESKV